MSSLMQCQPQCGGGWIINASCPESVPELETAALLIHNITTSGKNDSSCKPRTGLCATAARFMTCD